MRIVTFGEILLRLSPSGRQRFLQAEQFDVVYGGGEANAAVSLSSFGEDAAFVSKVPDNPIGQSAVNFLRRYGVNTDHVLRGGSRLGIYYLERGADRRTSKVFYDRAGSAIAEAKQKDFDWNTILKGADWFHFTGITPALGKELPEICADALAVCRKRGVRVSCDVNYRSKLWAAEVAGKAMERLLPYVDVCIANDEHIPILFGIEEKERTESGNISPAGCERIMRTLCARFGVKSVALTQRESLNADSNRWQGFYFDGNESCLSQRYTLHIVDRVGGGDAFAAGLIYALLHRYTPQHTIDFAMEAGALKHSIEGDVNLVSVREIEENLQGGHCGSVQR